MDWIKVNDRLPEDGDCVIGYDGISVEEVVFDLDENPPFRSGLEMAYPFEATHWVPFPDPPKE